MNLDGISTAVTRVALSDQVARRLQEFIAQSDMAPQSSLPSESELAKTFEVSRPVIREALRSLAGRGIVEIAHGKRAIVKAFDEEPLRLFFQRAMQIERNRHLEFLEVRVPLEVQSARLAAERRTPRDLAAMQEIVSEMRAHLHDTRLFGTLDFELHEQIALATQNEMMLFLIRSVSDSLKEASREGVRRLSKDEGQLDRVHRLHEAVVDAIGRQDPEEAGRAMEEHFNLAASALTYGGAKA